MNRLKELRQKNNVLQKDIAAFINVSQTAYSKYENDNLDISTNILIKLANFN